MSIAGIPRLDFYLSIAYYLLAARSRDLFPAAVFDFVAFSSSILHLFPWSGIIDENQELSNTFRVPDLKTGRMVRMITQLSTKEEEMFRNMIRRINTLVKVS